MAQVQLISGILPQQFYVYEHLRADDGRVFYVGKGKNRRAFVANRHHRSEYWHRVVNKSGGFEVRFVAQGIDEDLSFLVEMERIDQLRRLGSNLCNLTDGGDGVAGLVRTAEHSRKIGEKHKGKTVSEETRRKLSESVKKSGFVLTDEMRANISETHKGNRYSVGRVQPEEEKRKRAASLIGSKSRSGQTRSTEERAKVSAAMKGRPQAKKTCPHCGKIGGNTMSLYHFDACKERGKQ